MAVRPHDVLAGRGPRGSADDRLGEEDERSLGEPARVHLSLAGRDLLEVPSEMDGGCLVAGVRLPGHGTVERVVDLEGGVAVAVPAEGAPDLGRQAVAA